MVGHEVECGRFQTYLGLCLLAVLFELCGASRLVFALPWRLLRGSRRSPVSLFFIFIFHGVSLVFLVVFGMRGRSYDWSLRTPNLQRLT